MVTLSKIHKKFSEFIYIHDYNVIDVVLGAVVANQLPGDPVSLYIIGPPSSAKTEVLRSLQKVPVTYHLSKITPKTLFSGFMSKDGAVASLVPKLSGLGKNVIVMKDFTTVLSMPREAQTEIIGQIREVLDGYYTSIYGSGLHVEWSGKMAILAGVTPAIDTASYLNQVLGERFVCFRIRNEDQERIALKSFEASFNITNARSDLEDMVSEFIGGIDYHAYPLYSPHIQEKLLALSGFIAEMRTQVIRDSKRNIITPPIAEGAGRITKQLQYIGYGLGLVRGACMIDDSVYVVLKKIARDTLPQWRVEILFALYPSYVKTIKEIRETVALPESTLRMHLEDMTASGLLVADRVGKVYTYRISARLMSLIERSEILIADYI